MKIQTEAQFNEAVRQYALLCNWLSYHTHRSQYSPAGFPDWVFIRDDRIVVAELKADGGQLTPDQYEWLEAFKEAGAETYCWWPDDWDLIEKVLR